MPSGACDRGHRSVRSGAAAVVFVSAPVLVFDYRRHVTRVVPCPALPGPGLPACYGVLQPDTIGIGQCLLARVFIDGRVSVY